MVQQLILHDPSLRDGNHAVRHQISHEQIISYAKAINDTGIDVVEVGHGLGLGASSLQIGRAKVSDQEMLLCARGHLTKAKLGVHITPGYGRIKDLAMAFGIGVDVVRIAAHCSEANMTEQLVKYSLDHIRDVYVALTMSHMIDNDSLSQQVADIASYGAKGVILMDSAGHYLPQDVTARVQTLKQRFELEIGFHGHNNLSLAVANSISAVIAGADIVDGTIKGFGAGAGNTPLEILVAVLQRLGYCRRIDLSALLKVAEFAESNLIEKLPSINSSNILSGIYGVFCGFEPHVTRIANSLAIDPQKIYQALGERQIIAGQEDKIIEVAYQLKEETM